MLQVQVLTEQVAAQGEKMAELERSVTEKQHLLNNADDLLRRVSLFANLVGVQIDKQKVPETAIFFFASQFVTIFYTYTSQVSLLLQLSDCILPWMLYIHLAQEMKMVSNSEHHVLSLWGNALPDTFELPHLPLLAPSLAHIFPRMIHVLCVCHLIPTHYTFYHCYWCI